MRQRPEKYLSIAILVVNLMVLTVQVLILLKR